MYRIQKYGAIALFDEKFAAENFRAAESLWENTSMCAKPNSPRRSATRLAPKKPDGRENCHDVLLIFKTQALALVDR